MEKVLKLSVGLMIICLLISGMRVAAETAENDTELRLAVIGIVDGGTIELGGSFAMSSISIESKNITLDLKGNTLTYGGSDYAFALNGTSSLTIIDTAVGGTLKAEGGAGIAIRNNSIGSVNIYSGTVSATGSGGYAIHNTSIGSIIVSGGTVNSVNSAAIYNKFAGSVTVSGGTVKANNNNAIHNDSSGKITITGGKVTSANRIDMFPGTLPRAPGFASDNVLEVTGGKVENTAMSGFAVYNVAGGNVCISGGTISASGSTVNSISTGAVIITGGSVNSISMANGTPENRTGTQVKLYTFKALPTLAALSAFTQTPALADYSYGVNEVQADANGSLYFWLPESQAAATVYVTADGKSYWGVVENYVVLLKLIPQPQTQQTASDYISAGYRTTMTAVIPAPASTGNIYRFRHSSILIWQNGDKDLTFEIDAPLGLFGGLMVDGLHITSDNYKVESDTVVTLYAKYLCKLSKGTHKLRVIFGSGYAESQLIIN